MVDDIKKTFRQSAVYALGSISIKLIGLILIPIYTNQEYLSVNEYGAFSILDISSQMLIAIMGLTLSSSLTRWYWDATYIDKQKSIFFTSMTTLFAVSILGLAAGILLSEEISSLLFGHIEYAYIIVLLFIDSVFRIIIAQTLTLLKLQSKAGFFSVISIIKLTLSLLFTIYFIVNKGKTIDGIFEAQIIGSSIAFILLIPYIIKNSHFKIEIKILFQMLNFSYPLILASITGVFYSFIDRYALNYIEGLEKVGIYSLGYKIASTLKIVVITSIQLALSPILMKKMNESDNKNYYSKVMTNFSIFLMFCVIGISLFSMEAIKVAAKDIIYWESANIVAILSFSFFFSMLKDSAFIGLHVVKRTKISALFIVLSSLINLGLNILLIPRFNIYGAAIGTCISQLIFFVMIYQSAQKYYRIPYELNKVFTVLIAGIVLVSIGFFVNELNLGLRLVSKVVLLLTFPAFIYFGKIIKLEEVKLFFQNNKAK